MKMERCAASEQGGMEWTCGSYDSMPTMGTKFFFYPYLKYERHRSDRTCMRSMYIDSRFYSFLPALLSFIFESPTCQQSERRQHV